MNRTYKALSALLSYPSAGLIAALPEIEAALAAEPALDDAHRLALKALIDRLGAGRLIDLEETYVALFDRSRSLSLHLFEHVHGEARDRGQAMVDLAALYGQKGFSVAGRELPDYLPAFLEYLAMLPPEEARHLICDPLAIIQAVGERLDERGSDYAAVFFALVALAGLEPEGATLETLRAAPLDDPDDLAAVDAAWEEAAVRFGPGAPGGGPGAPQKPGGCPLAEEQVSRMQEGLPAAGGGRRHG